ncbi:phage tailspike protein, partial [Providencia rettgeri]
MPQQLYNVVVSMPNQLFTLARKFQAASNGKIYIGQIDKDPTIPENQIQVYLENEDGSTIPVAQPLIINQAGFPVYNGQIAKFVTVEGHSMAIYDSYGAQQFYYPNVLKYDPDQFSKMIGGIDGKSFIGSTNYTGLRDYTGANRKIDVYGVNNVFDGGYGEFSLDRNDKTSEDNSVTVLVDRLNRRWKRNYAGAVLPRFAGVVGDGVADDSNSCRLLIQAFKEKGVQAARGIDMQGQAIDWSGYTCKLSEPLDLSGMYNYTFINPTFTAASSFSGTELIRISSTVRYLQLDGITFINPNLDAKWNADYCIRASDFLKFMVMGGRITHYNKKGILTGEEMASAHELSLNGTIILQKDYEEDYPAHVTEGEAFEINNYDNEFVNVIIAFQ